jgi:hypothetical protein
VKQSFVFQLVDRYVHSVIAVWPLLATAVGVALALVVLGRFGLLARVTGWRKAVVLALVSAGALWWAWQLRWLCDDAYISFRYADNWARGLGPVFNAGEKVEGYTNFLWTAVLAVLIKLGAHPGQASLVISLGCFVGALLLLDRLALQVTYPEGRGLGIGALLAGASFLVANFATSGLETMFAATLVLLALERAQARKPMAAGLAGIAAAMSHPDHGIFYAALGVALAWQALAARGERDQWRQRWRDFLWYALPFVVVYLPYFFWRWRYYGDLFPNTYYAKSADQPYFQQGGIYVLSTVVIGGLWAMAPLGLLGAWHARRSVASKFLVVALPLYLVYVAKIGGDFMLGRLLITVLLIGCLFADVGFRELLARGRWLLTGSLVALAAVAAVPARTIKPLEKIWNLADEGTFYRLGKFKPPTVEVQYTQQAASLNMTLRPRGLTPKIAVGCVGIVGYETRLPLFDLFGLTSRSVARQPLLHRGRPGHEKLGTAGQALAAGVDLAEFPLYPEPFTGMTAVDIGGFRYFLSAWDQRFMNKLRGAAGFGDVPAQVQAMAFNQTRSAPEALACDNWFLESFYFRKTPDPELRQRLVDRAVANDSSLRGLESLLIDSRPLEAQGYSPLQTVGFERWEPWAVTGDAFQGWPQPQAVAGQSSVFGHRGNFVSTYRPVIFDAARGWMRLPPFTIKGELISLMVGGGQDVQRVRVSLVVDGQAVRTATGCGSEILGRRLWNVADFVGRTAHIEVVDDSAAGWGHIVVDEITEWRAPRRRAAAP